MVFINQHLQCMLDYVSTLSCACTTTSKHNKTRYMLTTSMYVQRKLYNVTKLEKCFGNVW
jgi:hypothetical protein